MTYYKIEYEGTKQQKSKVKDSFNKTRYEQTKKLKISMDDKVYVDELNIKDKLPPSKKFLIKIMQFCPLN